MACVCGCVCDVEQIAERHKCSIRHVNMTISMAFIAPGLVEAAVEGRLPRGIGVASLRDAPAEWSLQYERLGLIDSSKAGSQEMSGTEKAGSVSVFHSLVWQSTKLNRNGR
jgi:hypothetical protein